MIEVRRFINSCFNSNSYLVTMKGKQDAFLVDCGDVTPVLEELKAKALNLKAIFLTHIHFDHIYGLNKICNECPDVLVYVSEPGVKGLYSDKMNLSRYQGTSFVFQFEKNVRILNEGSMLLWPDSTEYIRSAYTPGHDISCMIYLIDDKLFTGDSFIPGVKVVTTFPHSNREDAEKSLDRISLLMNGVSIYPGHGDY